MTVRKVGTVYVNVAPKGRKGMNTKSIEDMRNEERAHVMHLAQEHRLTLDASDIEFAEGGHLPYIDGMDAEDWLQDVCGCGGTCLK